MQNLSLGQSLTDTDTSHQMSLKDLGVEVGGTSLDESDYNLNGRTINEESTNLEVMQKSLPVVNSKERSCEGFSESSSSTSEPSGSWGDFEGFEESLGESERFSQNLEVLVKSTETFGVERDLSSGHCSTDAEHFYSEPSLHSVIQEASSFLNEASQSYEDMFKLSFPEVFVSQSSESIRSLDQVLDTNNEDVGIPELTKDQLCTDSGNIWRTLRDFYNAPSLRRPWSKSHYQENLLSVLGIDANQKDFSESQDIFEESNVKDTEDFRFDGFSINDCKALIQTKLDFRTNYLLVERQQQYIKSSRDALMTKEDQHVYGSTNTLVTENDACNLLLKYMLSVSPNSRHGHLFTCDLFLKTTSSNGNMQYITTPRKKHIFAACNLKMKFFQ